MAVVHYAQLQSEEDVQKFRATVQMRDYFAWNNATPHYEVTRGFLRLLASRLSVPLD